MAANAEMSPSVSFKVAQAIHVDEGEDQGARGADEIRQDEERDNRVETNLRDRLGCCRSVVERSRALGHSDHPLRNSG